MARQVPSNIPEIDEIPEADAAEQQASVIEQGEAGETASAEVVDTERWDADAVDPDDERVVPLDEDDYR